MADLNPSGKGASSGERGQLILLTGFIIAVTFIALALVMNSAIYTENLATRSESSGASDALAYQRSMEHASVDAIKYANDVNNGTHADLEANVTETMGDVGNFTARQEATRTHAVNVSVAETHRGFEIGDENGDFTDINENANWTLAKDVDDVREFTIFVDDTGNDLNASGAKEFRLQANDTTTSTRWTMNVSTEGGTRVVGINDSGSYSECTVSGSQFEINFTEGTVDGDPCDALDFTESVPDPYKLQYMNASAIRGNYSMVVNSTNSNFLPEANGPYRHEALYSMTVRVTYWTPKLEYRSEIRIAPGEPDA